MMKDIAYNHVIDEMILVEIRMQLGIEDITNNIKRQILLQFKMREA